MSMWTPERIEQVLTNIGVASAGGVARVLMNSAGEQNIIVPMMIEAVCSAVVGYIVFLACIASGMSLDYTGAVVGLSGLIGARSAIELLRSIVLQKLGVQIKKEGEQ